MKKAYYLSLCVIASIGIFPGNAKCQIITTFAGSTLSSYGGDGGPATAALLDQPMGVTVDAAGNVYIADATNNCIRKIDLTGIITTIAGSGVPGFAGDGGAATSAMLYVPSCVALDAAGNIFIADYGNNRIREINSSGIINTVAGSSTGGFAGDGSAATAAELQGPSGVAVDASGNIYIADELNDRIRMVSTSHIISTIGGNGTAGYSGDGVAATATQLYHPSGILINSSGVLYIADKMNSRVRMIDGSGYIYTFAGGPLPGFSGDGGPATAAELYLPSSIVQDAAGDIYICDMINSRIREVSTVGTIATVAGSSGVGLSGDGGPATSAWLSTPQGVTLDMTGNIYIADRNNNRVRKVNTAGIINTLAGSGPTSHGDGGPATAAQFNGLWGMASDAAGNIYIADEFNNAVRKVSTSGIITTFAGNGTQGFSGDGGPATNASFYAPVGIAIDNTGNVYIVDNANFRIRKVDITGVVTTYAGNGMLAFSGDGGPATAAGIGNIVGIAMDAAGNMYIDGYCPSKIRKIDHTGIISTIAGTGTVGYSGDGGPATTANFAETGGIAVDTAGDVYISDVTYHVIRKVDAGGIVTTIAGTGTGGYGGDGGPATAAQLNWPYNMMIDNYGNLFVCDYANSRVRVIGTSGNIYTFAGDGTPGYSGDGGLATGAKMYTPAGICKDPAGNVYISDDDANVIREVSPNLVLLTGKQVITAGINLFPNPATSQVTIIAPAEMNNISISDIAGRSLFDRDVHAAGFTVDISGWPAGMYIVKISGFETTRFTKE